MTNQLRPPLRPSLSSKRIRKTNFARRELHGKTNPPGREWLPRFADEPGICERCVSNSSATDGARLPKAAALSETFQAPAVVIDDEQRPLLIHQHSGDVQADLLHERFRLQVDDVPGALRGYEQVLVVGHHGDRSDAHVTGLEASDPRPFADPDARKMHPRPEYLSSGGKSMTASSEDGGVSRTSAPDA